MIKDLNFEQMSVKLKKRFPNLVVKDGNDFDNERTEIGKSFWLPNSEDITYTSKDSNTLYKCFGGKGYDLEVYEKFDKWCNRYGWYATTDRYTMEIFK